MLGNASDFVLLSFDETLGRLASWEGREVRWCPTRMSLVGPSHTPRPCVLGRLQMVDDAIDATADSVAGFSVGAVEPNGFYLSLADVRHAQPLPGTRGDWDRLPRLRDPGRPACVGPTGRTVCVTANLTGHGAHDWCRQGPCPARLARRAGRCL